MCVSCWEWGHIMRKLLWVGLLTLGSPAWAETAGLPDHEVTAWGTGGLRCANVRELMEQYGGPQQVILVAWVSGYISGINRYYPGGSAGQGKEVQAVVMEAIDWCVSNPGQPFYRGVDSVLGITVQGAQQETGEP